MKSASVRFFLVGALATILIMPGGSPPVSDSPTRLGVAHWLLTGQPPMSGLPSTAPLALHDRRGNETPWYGIGQSLVMAPFDAAAILVGARTATERFRVVQYLLFPLLNGLLVAVGAELLVALGFSALGVAAGALSLTFASTALWHFQNNQENTLSFLLVAAALLAMLRWTERRARHNLIVAGVCLGLDFLIRIPNIVDAALVSAVPLLMLERRAEYRREWIRTVLPMLLVAVGVDRLYQFERFGNWTGTYMHMSGEVARQMNLAVPPGFPFSSPWWRGMSGPFVSLERSILLFDPLLLVCLFAGVRRWPQLRAGTRALLPLSAAGILLYAAGYATFYNWGGASGWGDRFLTTWVWVAVLLTLPILVDAGLSRRWLAALVSCCLVIQLSSIVLPSWVDEGVVRSADAAAPPPLQLPESDFGHFIIGSRLRNIVALARGSKEIHPPVIPIFMPLDSLSAPVRLAARGVWLALFAMLLMMVWSLLRRAGLTRKESHTLARPKAGAT